MRTRGYLTESDVARLCLEHHDSPWFLDQAGHVLVIYCDGKNDRFPANFWWVDENGGESLLAPADYVETIADGCPTEPGYQPELRCLAGDVYDSFRELTDLFSCLDVNDGWRF